MKHLETSQDRDELRGRFTTWLKILVSRAKIDYIRGQKRYNTEISIEDTAISKALLYNLSDYSIGNIAEFDFENDRVAFAFSQLPPKRGQVLTMLFVQNMTPQDIAEKLHCTIEHVYKQRFFALKELKRILNKEE